MICNTDTQFCETVFILEYMSIRTQCFYFVEIWIINISVISIKDAQMRQGTLTS